MNNNILFYFCDRKLSGELYKIGEGTPYRIGEMISLAHACYIRGRELGFNDNHIFMQWPQVKYNIKLGCKYEYLKPNNDFLPIKFIYYSEIDFDNYDRVINLNEPDSLYDGCPSYAINERKSYIVYNYFNKYVINHKITPEIIIPTNHKKFTILIHIRKSYYSTERNTDLNIVRQIVGTLRTKYKNNIDICCTGDIYKEMEIDFNIFDRCYTPKIKDITEFFHIVNDSDIVICPLAGVLDITRMLGKPKILLLGDMDLENGDKMIFGTKQYWKNIPNRFNDSSFGETSYTWENKEKYIFFGNNSTIEDVISFIGKYYESDKQKRLYTKNKK